MAATSQQQAQRHAITLKGSTDIVAEFFQYGVNSILYQRGIYPAETFTRTQKYGLTLLVTADDKLKDYLALVLGQVKAWLKEGTIRKFVIVIKSVETNEVIERWQFNVECDKTGLDEAGQNIGKAKVKSEKDINNEIKAVIRQITATVTFLPLIDTACEFDLLVYTDKDLDVPSSWGDCGPQFIDNSEEVRLRSFNTLIHKVDTMVAYKTS